MTEPLLLATTYRFQVSFSPSGGRALDADAPPVPVPAEDTIGHGGFQECTGLEMEMDVSEYQEGGRNDALVQRAGRLRYPKLVLKRGMFVTPADAVQPELWVWLRDVVGGIRPIRRYDGLIWMFGTDRNVLARWAFRRALPAKLVGPQLNARTGEVAIEEIHLAHEGLRMVV